MGASFDTCGLADRVFCCPACADGRLQLEARYARRAVRARVAAYAGPIWKGAESGQLHSAAWRIDRCRFYRCAGGDTSIIPASVLPDLPGEGACAILPHAIDLAVLDELPAPHHCVENHAWLEWA